MLKMKIEIDEQRIRNYGKKIADSVNTYLDDLFLVRYGMRREDDCYLADSSELLKFGFINRELSKLDWFLGSVKTWLFYVDDEPAGPNSYTVEDVLSFYRPQLLKTA
jgi:hypothetical protein